MSELCDFGLIGLAVMGENLALNVESRGYRVAVFNRTTEKVDELMAGRAKGKNFLGCHSIVEMVKNLKRPRLVMMLVKAGPAVDDLIEQLLPHLEPGDILVDGGNTHYVDTERRTQYVESKGLLFVGSGVSGGEEGALKGPSLMPGGSKAAWETIKPIFQSIAAKVGPKNDIPCCEWVGPRGAGHYVKMVHNGIEYGDMQLICEAYFLLKEAAGLSNDELYDVFADWNLGELQSYLIEISRDIFSGLKLSDQKRVRLKLKGKVKTDAVALHRILENLVLNALRHSDGNVDVTQTHKANQLTLLVNGGATKSKRTKGWGIGLLSSRDLAKRLGYALTIDIKPGRSQARLVSPKSTKQ